MRSPTRGWLNSLTVGMLSWPSTHVSWPISSIASSQLRQQSFSSVPAGIIDPGYSSAGPRFPALTDRLCVLVHIDFFQPLDAVLHRIGHYFGRFFIFFPGRFEERPEKRQRKNTPVHIPQRRLHLDFSLSLGGRGVADCEANRDSDPQRGEDRWHGVFAH